MTSVANAISALLYTHDTVIVPGLGAFLCHVEGAKVNVITNHFEKPSATLGFDPLQREENDLIVNYLVMNDGITVEEARQLVMEFVSGIFASLKAGDTAEIADVGSFSYGENQELVFTAVASNDYNGDAFGLDDITPQPVYGTGQSTQKTEQASREPEQESQKTQETRQETPTTEQEPLDDDHCRRNGWIWILLLILILAAAGVALWYFKFRQVPVQPQPDVKTNDTIVITNDTMVIANDTMAIANDTMSIVNDTLVIANDTLAVVNDTVAVVKDTVTDAHNNSQDSKGAPVKVVMPEPTSKAFIVGGCFSVEEYALRMVTEARGQGCADAFVMKRGSKYYVCYGQYPSADDAKAALPDVMSNFNDKVWIMKK